MASSVKVVTIEKQLETNVQLDKELATTIKNFKNLDAERSKKSGGAKALNTLKVRRLLKKEYYDVVKDVYIAKSGAKKIQDEKTYTELATLLKDFNSFASKIQEKQSFLKEIDASIVERQNQIAVITYKVPSNIQWEQRVQRAGKSLEALENKLNTFVKQYGLISTESRHLREQIDHMLTERINFNTLWYSFVINLNTGKKILMDVVEQAVLAYNLRDEYIARLNALRSFAMNDLLRNSHEMESLQQQLDNDKQIEEFVGLKQQSRNMKDLFEKKNQKKIQRKTEIQKKFQNHKQVLEKIQNFADVKCESNTNEFVAKFVSTETINISYFNYINDLHNELENANEELVQRTSAIENQKAINEHRAEQQKVNLNALKIELKANVQEVETAKQSLNGVNKVLKQIYSGLDKLFKLCKCSNAPFLHLLGENSSINHYNSLLYLKVLEESVDGYLANVYYKEKVGGKGKSVKPFVPIIDEDIRPLDKCFVEVFCPTHPCPLCVDREMVSDVIDNLQRVETRDEVKDNLTNRLELPDGLDRLHNVSACNLPKSRQIIQKRYQ